MCVFVCGGGGVVSGYARLVVVGGGGQVEARLGLKCENT